MSEVKLFQGDCLTIMQDLIDDGVKVDLVLTDVPYGTVNNLSLDGWKTQTTEWDNTIPTEPMFKSCEKLLRMNGTCILFSQEPYTSYLRQFKPENLPFIYPLYWFKDHFANPFNSKSAPVSYVEDLSVFRKRWDSDNKHPLRIYAQQLLNEMGVSYKDIERRLGHRRAEHFFYRVGSSQFSLCTENTYNELIDVYHINELDCFKPYNELKEINANFKLTFNVSSNLKDGKSYKSNVLEYPKSYNHYHPTEKPVPLLEDLILTYSNEGDTVLDFTMGSGSTGVACLQTNRDFIGIELEPKYYEIAEQRIKEAKAQRRLI